MDRQVIVLVPLRQTWLPMQDMEGSSVALQVQRAFVASCMEDRCTCAGSPAPSCSTAGPVPCPYLALSIEHSSVHDSLYVNADSPLDISVHS